MEDVDDLLRASRRSGVAELVWTDEQGASRATAVVPLEHEGRPTLALHWSAWGSARELAACPAVALVLSDRRQAQRDWVPGVLHGRVRLLVDDDGSVFSGTLLDQELRKHPPSRAYADSAVLRREHWWFLPRLLLVLEPTRSTTAGERRDAEATGVLAVASADGGLDVDTVAVHAAGGGAACTSLAGRPAPGAGPAVLLRHDFSVPDLERWGRCPAYGRWDGRVLHTDDVVTGPVLPPVPGLRERLRRHRELERQCRQALKDHPPA